MGQALTELFRKQSRGVQILIVLSIAWMVLIFCMSAQNSEESSSLSSGLLTRLLSWLTPDWDSMGAREKRLLLEKWHTFFRKLGHFSEYAVLGALLTAALRIRHTERQSPPFTRVWLPPLAALCYAATDEFHQRFVPGRSCELRDVMIDFSGALLGTLTVLCILHLHRKRQEKRESEEPLS